jgi:regulatory protein
MMTPFLPHLAERFPVGEHERVPGLGQRSQNGTDPGFGTAHRLMGNFVSVQGRRTGRKAGRGQWAVGVWPAGRPAMLAHMTGRRSRRERGEAKTPGDARPVRPSTPPSPEQAREALLMYAFRALGQRALSEAELKTRMLRRDPDQLRVDEVLARVKELGYLNDAGVARQEAARRNVGAHRVRQKLRQRGVDSELIEAAIGQRDPDAEQQELDALLERRWPTFVRARDPRARAYAFLARRGYGGDAIRRALASMPTEAAEDAVPDGLDDSEP